MKRDRRSGIDRRNTSRYGLLLDIEYEDVRGRQTGTLSDISANGCFILGKGQVQDGDEIRIFLPLTGGMSVLFEGTVANHLLEIGFAVNFSAMSPAQAEFLENFIDMQENTSPEPRG